jgi:hypothetical protein
MNRMALNELKQQIPLLEYLQAHDWQQARPIGFGRLLGLCPLHADRKPSFLVDPNRNLFYCYGCRRGGDVIRFAELYHQVKFPQALALLHQWRGLPPLLHEAAGFYHMQLHRHGEAIGYLHQRGIRSAELIEHMRIGYAPGGCLRGWLTQLGYPLRALHQAGLVTARGYDTYTHRVVFPLQGNLYGRSLSVSAPPHRFLSGTKGGLYAWEQVRQYPTSFSSRVCSTMPCYGKPVFTTSPVRWEVISTGSSIASYVTVREPSIWHSMPIRTAAAGRRRSRLPAGSESKA